MEDLDQTILNIAQAQHIKKVELVQTLWSNYGSIKRYFLEGGRVKSIIIKHILPPEKINHPRGWNTDVSHQRKLKSYDVEYKWYKNYSNQILDISRIPNIYYSDKSYKEIVLIMEDLNAFGFSIRRTPQNVSITDAKNCLRWLACFHAQLWSKMINSELKNAAHAIDDRLNNVKFKTVVHGDAKLANFCFDKNNQVAAVDFQYVGEGCGMKDVAYFIGSCLSERDCERLEEQILDTYFECLQSELPERNEALEKEWRSLYRVAWADFHRFLKGWSPSHWKINSYSERVTAEVIKNL